MIQEVYSSKLINCTDIKNIGDKIKNGSLIIYPTDTVYGIAGSIYNIDSIKKIYQAKERKFNSPLIALISNEKYIKEIAYIEEKKLQKLKILAKNFWPGALTIILRKKEIVPEIMVSNGETIGIRIPDLDIALKIIESAGGILPTTSANISGEDSPTCFNELSNKIKSRVDILVDDGKCKKGNVSTIIDLTGDNVRILREAAIKKEEIEKILGEVIYENKN